MSRPNTPTYKTLNLPAYNKALKRRGSLAIWFDLVMVWAARPTGKRGRQPVYSDAAVQTCLTMKVLFGMALRQTTGFNEHLFTSLRHARQLIEAWRDDYNHHRPHTSLDGLTPREFRNRSVKDQTLNRTNF